MSNSRLPLDVDLVWASPPANPQKVSPKVASSTRLWLAALADAGVAGLCCLLSLALASSRGVALSHLQVALTVLFALLILATTLEVGWLWCFHVSVGMSLANLRFSRGLLLTQALKVWYFLLLCAPLLEVPPVVGRKGLRALERVAGSEITEGIPREGV